MLEISPPHTTVEKRKQLQLDKTLLWVNISSVHLYIHSETYHFHNTTYSLFLYSPIDVNGLINKVLHQQVIRNPLLLWKSLLITAISQVL
jgi:hypothetical protein